MIGHNTCFYGKIWKIIPVMSTCLEHEPFIKRFSFQAHFILGMKADVLMSGVKLSN